MQKFNDNVIVSLNKFDDDLESEIEYVKSFVEKLNVKFVISTMYEDGDTVCI